MHQYAHVAYKIFKWDLNFKDAIIRELKEDVFRIGSSQKTNEKAAHLEHMAARVFILGNDALFDQTKNIATQIKKYSSVNDVDLVDVKKI